LEALEIREETSWGTSRPGYGAIVERVGEVAIIRAADLVVPVSADLDAVLEGLGLPSDRRLVLPNGVDIARFSPGRADADLRRDHGMDGRFAVGWIGGFRPFHGLEVIPALARELKERVPNALLCLVGTGPLRQRLIEETNGLDDVLRVLPPIPHEDVPRWIRSFDTCLLLGTSDVFHYSPMKLFEYLSCGRPVVAVGVGQVRQVITDGINGYLVEPGDIRSVVDRISRLAEDHSLRERMGNAARSGAEQSCSWGSRVDVLMEELRARYLVTSPANPLR
jgi:glycosyltransferase involved in cell wall biosynthesis